MLLFEKTIEEMNPCLFYQCDERRLYYGAEKQETYSNKI
jgi:hypothetical protein